MLDKVLLIHSSATSDNCVAILFDSSAVDTTSLLGLHVRWCCSDSTSTFPPVCGIAILAGRSIWSDTLDVRPVLMDTGTDLAEFLSNRYAAASSRKASETLKSFCVEPLMGNLAFGHAFGRSILTCTSVLRALRGVGGMPIGCVETFPNEIYWFL